MLPDEIPIYTGNLLIDMVLHGYKQRLAGTEIDFTISGMLPQRFEVEGRDMRILLGNIMQNAVEACEAANTAVGARPFIRFRTSYEQIGLVIEVINSTAIELAAGLPHCSRKRGAAAYGYGETTILEIVRC